ncbi:MAG: UDP-N-acetylmuramate--L-alanine ligase [Firmicutes bacterium]|nr:UDP-N-acetylmuramate--L-alanine ligase [Bacillota bacterium]
MAQGPFHAHFVGIGGIGMSGIARLLVELGWRVSGSDIVASEKTTALAAAGVAVHIGHSGEYAAGADVVVFSAAVPEDNCELVYARQHGIPVMARAEMLGRLMEKQYGIAVAGSHGKTTTTSMIALVLQKLGQDPSVVVGGEILDMGANGRLGLGPHLVVEADESDGSLVALAPHIAVITNIDADHLDHYGDLTAIKDTFLAFMERVKHGGLVITCADDLGLAPLVRQVDRRHVDYGFDQRALWWADHLEFTNFGSRSTVYRGNEVQGHLELQVPGKHNVSNALAAMAVAEELDLAIPDVLAALSEFRGVHRRFEIVGEIDGAIVIDDYAHHPTEIKATLAAARHLHRRVIVVFQPHRYSRVARLLDEFTTCFADTDELLVTEIYSAGENPIPGVSGKWLAEQIQKASSTRVQYFPDQRDIAEVLDQCVRDGDLVLTMGAGDIRHVAEDFLSRRKGQVITPCPQYVLRGVNCFEVIYPSVAQKMQF